MEAVKGLLAPLGLYARSIQDTLVCILVFDYHFTPWQYFEPYLSETDCHRRYGRDSPEGLDIRVEWNCGLFVSPFIDRSEAPN